MPITQSVERLCNKLTHYSAQVEHPSPWQHLLDPIADGKGQTVADVDTPVVDANSRTTEPSRKIVPDNRHSKRTASSSSVRRQRHKQGK